MRTDLATEETTIDPSDQGDMPERGTSHNPETTMIAEVVRDSEKKEGRVKTATEASAEIATEASAEIATQGSAETATEGTTERDPTGEGEGEESLNGEGEVLVDTTLATVVMEIEGTTEGVTDLSPERGTDL